MNISRILLTTALAATAMAATSTQPAMFNRAVRSLGTENITQAWTSGDRAVAAFNRNGGGFAITTADGSLVGYSDSGAFDIATVPPALMEILEQPCPQGVSASRADYTPVEPLLGKIAWDQLDPYNLLCPVYYGSQRSATGCAATAMAQIMRYHNYPARGKGKHSYTPDNTSLGMLEVDFSQSEYDWKNMTPTYGEMSTEAQRQAVARLMLDAGVAISMNYGAQSGAMSQDWPEALVRYFDYDPGVTLLQRAYVDGATWNAAIRAELDAGRPVFATGFTDAGGHAFVFDGYDRQGMVHVNWGWSGMSNGYFDTAWLTPATQGTGGSNGGFNSRQLIVTGIQPPTGENLATVILVSEEGLAASPSRIDKGTPAKIKLSGKVYNQGWQPTATFVTALSVIDANGKEVARSAYSTESITLPKGASTVGLTFPEIDLSGLADGDYRIYAIVRGADGGRDERIQDRDLDFPNYLTATVADGQIRFDIPAMSQLAATAPAVSGKIYSGSKALIATTLNNTGGTAYHGVVAIALTDPATGRTVAKGDEFIKDVNPGESIDAELTAVFNVEPASYGLVIVDRSGHIVSEAIQVEVVGATADSPIATKSPDFGDNEHVDPLNVVATASITTNAGTVFSGHLYLYIYYPDTNDVAGSIGPVFAQADDSGDTEVVFEGRFENGRPGHTYEARLVNGETFTYIKPNDIAWRRFTIDGDASIENIGTDADCQAKYYSLDGRRLKAAPSQGLYIEVKDGKTVKKLAK